MGVQFFLIFSNLEVGNMEGFTIGTSTTSTRRRIGKYSRLVTDRLLSKLHKNIHLIDVPIAGPNWKFHPVDLDSNF